MNGALKAVILFMINKGYIGGRHTPEKKLVKSKTKWLKKEDKRNFEREYIELIRGQFILKARKRTGKDYDWHICLNPRKLKEIIAITEQEG